MRKRRIIGIQVHHSATLGDATRGIANAAAGLRGALTASGDPAIEEVLEEANAIARRIGGLERAARERLREFYERDPEGFKRARDGAIPWPDETLAGFEPRCTCHDTCQIHDGGRSPDEGWACQCDPCPAHPEADAA